MSEESDQKQRMQRATDKMKAFRDKQIAEATARVGEQKSPEQQEKEIAKDIQKWREKGCIVDLADSFDLSQVRQCREDRMAIIGLDRQVYRSSQELSKNGESAVDFVGYKTIAGFMEKLVALYGEKVVDESLMIHRAIGSTLPADRTNKTKDSYTEDDFDELEGQDQSEAVVELVDFRQNLFLDFAKEPPQAVLDEFWQNQQGKFDHLGPIARDTWQISEFVSQLRGATEDLLQRSGPEFIKKYDT